MVSYVREVFEELEQIPWSELVAKPKRAGRWALVAVAVLLALGVLLVGFRNPSVDVPVTVTPEASPSVPVVTETALMMSEADLQAAEGSEELLALGAAVVEVRTTSSPTHYVEWAVAEGLTPLGSNRWSVQVAFQVLLAGPDGPVRSSIRRVAVPIEVEDGRAGRAGPIHLASYDPALPIDAWPTEDIALTQEIIDDVLPLFADWGDVTVESAGSHRELVRVMVDTGSMDVSVWFDGEKVVSGLPVPESAP